MENSGFILMGFQLEPHWDIVRLNKMESGTIPTWASFASSADLFTAQRDRLPKRGIQIEKVSLGPEKLAEVHESKIFNLLETAIKNHQKSAINTNYKSNLLKGTTSMRESSPLWTPRQECREEPGSPPSNLFHRKGHEWRT